MAARALHRLIALERRVVDGAKQVLAPLGPLDEELGVTAQVDSENSQDLLSELLERRVELEHERSELRHLGREDVLDRRRRIRHVPELHLIGPRVAHRVLGPGRGVAHLPTLEWELVLLALLERHAGHEDALHRLQCRTREIHSDVVPDDRHETDVSGGGSDFIGELEILLGVAGERTDVMNGNPFQLRFGHFSHRVVFQRTDVTQTC